MAEKIKLVLFDMDNVLCDYDKTARAEVLAAFSSSTASEVLEAIWGSGFEQLGDSGALSAAEYLTSFGERIGYPLSLDEWLEARRAATRPDTAMLDIVRDCRRSVAVAVLTNNSGLVVDHIDLLFPELRPLIASAIYASAQFKTAKPDPECYRLCLEQLQVRPECALFVDDLTENVAGARKAGLLAHRYRSAEGLRRELERYGILEEGSFYAG